MGMAAILVMWPGPFEHTFIPPSHGHSIRNLILIGPVVSEEMFKEWRQQTTGELKSGHHFLHYKSMGETFCSQGRITPNWMIRSGPNSNLFEFLCLSSLPASLTKIQSKVTEKSWRHNFFHRSKACNSKMTGQIQRKFELVQDFMPVLVTCKFDEDWIHSNWEKMKTSFSPFKVNGNAQGRITP